MLNIQPISIVKRYQSSAHQPEVPKTETGQSDFQHKTSKKAKIFCQKLINTYNQDAIDRSISQPN